MLKITEYRNVLGEDGKKHKKRKDRFKRTREIWF